MSRSIAGKIKINSFADLVGGGEDGAVEVPLADLHDFRNHPFRVVDDEKMEETVQSIKEHGVLVPGIARPAPGGGYELISGHRRKRACELAGQTTMPVLIRKYSDEEAVCVMVDANIQREDILPSEKAKAYRMKFEAMKHQGSKEGGRTLDTLGEAAGESGKTVQRYICLSNLSDGLLKYVDEKKLPIRSGVMISYLDRKEQGWVESVIRETGTVVMPAPAKKIRDTFQMKELTKALVKQILSDDKPKLRKFVLNPEKLAGYFPDEVSEEEIEKTILKLLDEWKKNTVAAG